MPVILPTSPSVLGHIFRDKRGHLRDTIENRQLLLSLTNDEDTRIASDKYGNQWHAKLLLDGTQLWAQTRHGVITDGGLNLYPKLENMQTGLKKS